MFSRLLSTPKKAKKMEMAPTAPLTPVSNSRPRGPAFKNGQCTHLTMTRMYNKDFRCPSCLRTQEIGWLYRCTQDRELILEDDLEKGLADKFDVLCDIFPCLTEPRKRSPGARASKLSFLQEVSDEQLKTYTPEQLAAILNQRDHLQEVLDAETPCPHCLADLSFYSPANIISDDRNPSPSPAAKPAKKPWLPIQGGECQFKCCHFCRPSLIDRSWLSLNGIVNDDIPVTAITGFGFNLNRKRPVALVKNMKDIGLRTPLSPTTATAKLKQRLRRFGPPSGMGLGFFSPNFNNESAVEQSAKSGQNASLNPSTYQPPNFTNPISPFIHYGLPTPLLPPLAQSFTHGAPDGFIPAFAVLTPLPPQTPTELATLSAPTTPLLSSGSLTPMEEKEFDGGIFGSAPLELKNGVAVTEEAVGFHVADLITQF